MIAQHLETMQAALAFTREGSAPNVVVIDGRSGSGKTTLAHASAHTLGSRAQILPVEHLYPGWRGLERGADAVAEALEQGWYRMYDWHEHRFTSERQLDRARPLVIEGCGSLSSANLVAAANWGRVWSVWVECSTATRRRRALARDGEVYRPYWDMWARQEEARMLAEGPVTLAHQIIHTDPPRDSSSTARG